MGGVGWVHHAGQWEADGEVGHLRQGYRLDGPTVNGSQIRELKFDAQNIMRGVDQFRFAGGPAKAAGCSPGGGERLKHPRYAT